MLVDLVAEAASTQPDACPPGQMIDNIGLTGTIHIAEGMSD